MSLFAATLTVALVLAVLGGLLLWNGPEVRATAKAFPRSERAATILFGAGAVWFLYNVTQLGEADFGQYRWLLFGIFGAVAILAFRLVPDFLAVRGLAILILLAAHPLLGSAYMQYDQPGRLFLVGMVYAGILTALVIGGLPYRLRDFIGWLFATQVRPRILGALLTGYAAILIIAAFTY